MQFRFLFRIISLQAIFGLAVECVDFRLLNWALLMGVALFSTKCECHNSASIRPWVRLSP